MRTATASSFAGGNCIKLCWRGQLSVCSRLDPHTLPAAKPAHGLVNMHTRSCKFIHGIRSALAAKVSEAPLRPTKHEENMSTSLGLAPCSGMKASCLRYGPLHGMPDNQ